jgi:hypothetical protein
MDVLARDLPAELRNFGDYARAVAADSVGPHRVTWQERAEWADACAAAAEGAVEALQRIERLRAKWDAPDSGGDQAWAAVGSEAHKIASDFLRGQ